MIQEVLPQNLQAPQPFPIGSKTERACRWLVCLVYLRRSSLIFLSSLSSPCHISTLLAVCVGIGRYHGGLGVLQHGRLPRPVTHVGQHFIVVIGISFPGVRVQGSETIQLSTQVTPRSRVQHVYSRLCCWSLLGSLWNFLGNLGKHNRLEWRLDSNLVRNRKGMGRQDFKLVFPHLQSGRVNFLVNLAFFNVHDEPS